MSKLTKKLFMEKDENVTPEQKPDMGQCAYCLTKVPTELKEDHNKKCSHRPKSKFAHLKDEPLKQD